LAAAIARAQRSAACGAEGELLGAVRGLQAEAHVFCGDVIETERFGLEAMELLPRESAPWFNAAGAVAMAAFRRGDRGRLVSVGEDLCRLELTEDSPLEQLMVMAQVAKHLFRLGLPRQAELLFDKLEDAPAQAHRAPAVAANISAAIAVRAAIAGDPAATLDALEASAASFEQAGDRRNAVLQRVHLGVTRAATGFVTDVEAELRGVLALAEREGIAQGTAWV
jgi:hypothetical protein